MARPTAKQLLRLAAGIGLSAAALYLALRKTSPGEVREALSHVAWMWLPAVVALKAATLLIKDLRWRVELGAMAPGPYRRTFRAIGLGYFGNMVLPFKLGELLRVGLLKRHNPQVGVGDALATVAAERAIDGAVLAIMVGAVLPFATVPAWVMRGTAILLAVMLTAIVIAMLRPIHELAMRILPERGLWRIGRKVIRALSAGTAVLRRPRDLAAAVALTALAWIGEAAAFLCAQHAIGLELGFSAALVVTLLLSVGLLIPSAPGQIGTHQALTTLFLVPFGVAAATAVSLSIVLQIVTLGTLGSVGGYVLVREAGARRLVAEAAVGEETGATSEKPHEDTEPGSVKP